MASFQPVRLAYLVHEPVCGTDPNLAPIIYLHGITSFKEIWEDIPQVVANATKRISYSLDSRNHGDSEWSEVFNFDVNADDLLHFMDTQRIQKAIIVGHSMGAITAIKTALRKPDRIEKIVVEDMLVRRLPQFVIDMVLTYVSLMKIGLQMIPVGMEEDEIKKLIMQHFVANLPSEMKRLSPSDSNYDPKTDYRFLSLRRDANGRYTFRFNAEVIERALRNTHTLSSEPQGRFAGPACFIYGKLSPMLVGADEHHIRQFFPNAILEGLDEVGHDIHILKPLEFTDILLKFIG